MILSLRKIFIVCTIIKELKLKLTCLLISGKLFIFGHNTLMFTLKACKRVCTRQKVKTKMILSRDNHRSPVRLYNFMVMSAYICKLMLLKCLDA